MIILSNFYSSLRINIIKIHKSLPRLVGTLTSFLGFYLIVLFLNGENMVTILQGWALGNLFACASYMK